jgi:hypothetical protein
MNRTFNGVRVSNLGGQSTTTLTSGKGGNKLAKSGIVALGKRSIILTSSPTYECAGRARDGRKVRNIASPYETKSGCARFYGFERRNFRQFVSSVGGDDGARQRTCASWRGFEDYAHMKYKKKYISILHRLAAAYF